MDIQYFHNDIATFLNSLEKTTRAKVNRLIRLLSEKEYRLTMPYSRRLEKHLYELRARSGQNVRVFYTFYENKVVLLHIVSKKTQKLEKKDLMTAQSRLTILHGR